MARDFIILECTEARAEGKAPSRYISTRNKKSPNTPTLSAAVVSTGGLDFSRELGDIHTRYLPTFDDQEAAARLQTEMDVITERLAAGDVDSVRAAIGRARDLLVPGVAHPVDLYALRRTFDVLESYLQ